jgi:hypothetical protein
MEGSASTAAGGFGACCGVATAAMKIKKATNTWKLNFMEATLWSRSNHLRKVSESGAEEVFHQIQPGKRDLGTQPECVAFIHSWITGNAEVICESISPGDEQTD